MGIFAMCFALYCCSRTDLEWKRYVLLIKLTLVKYTSTCTNSCNLLLLPLFLLFYNYNYFWNVALWEWLQLTDILSFVCFFFNCDTKSLEFKLPCTCTYMKHLLSNVVLILKQVILGGDYVFWMRFNLSEWEI